MLKIYSWQEPKYSLLIAAVHMSTSTQRSARSPLKARIGNNSNIVCSLKFCTSLVTSPEDLPQTRVGVKEGISFHIDVGLHHRDKEVQVLLVTGHLALQLQVLFPQPLSLLLVRKLLPLLLLRHACHANTFLSIVLESSLD